MNEWQPIETAPKDETRIWAWFPFAKQTYAIRWRQNIYELEPNWTLDDGESATLTYDPPAYWMPLPTFPLSSE
jgi:hypothetical protein